MVVNDSAESIRHMLEIATERVIAPAIVIGRSRQECALFKIAEVCPDGNIESGLQAGSPPTPSNVCGVIVAIQDIISPNMQPIAHQSVTLGF
jgi:hypothetical protein